MDFEKPVTTKRSLGSLRRAQKGKPKSPDMIGTLNFQCHTASAMLKVFAETDLDEVICNLAGWRNQDSKGNPYLTVEISPRYTSQVSTPRASSNLDFIFKEDGGPHVDERAVGLLQRGLFENGMRNLLGIVFVGLEAALISARARATISDSASSRWSRSCILLARS